MIFLVIATIVVFLLLLTVLVIIHEFGHFFMARRFGIKVEEFAFGFPPRAIGIKKGETMYSINWLPIGGYVKLYGEDEAGGGKFKVQSSKFKVKDEERAFYARPVWQRAGVGVAGVVMNVLLAIMIFYIFLTAVNFKTDLPLFGDHKFFLVNQTNLSGVMVNRVAPNSPASEIGMRAPLKILSLNKEKVKDSNKFRTIISKHKGKEVLIEWEETKTGLRYSAKVTPRVSPPKNQGALGVELEYIPFPLARLSYDTPMQKAFSGIIHPMNFIWYQVDILGGLIGKSFKEKTAEPVSGAVAGPVGIGFLVGNILQIPNLKVIVLELLNLAGIFSITLAFFNVLPIPALDGGRLFFILLEGVTRRKVNPVIEARIHAIGMALLLTFMLFVTYQDILRFLLRRIPILQP